MVEPPFSIDGAEGFLDWLVDQDLSIAFSTYQAGKLFLLGRQPEKGLSVFERSFDRCMGLCFSDRRIWLSTKFQIWRFEDFLDKGQNHDGFDCVFVPVTSHTTGDVDVHDLTVQQDGTPLFVVTRFNCLATLSERGSFSPIWKPSFIDRIVAEDRCHLNGLAIDDSGARFVTCLGRSSVNEGWREHRSSGGLVIETGSDEVLSSGLSMPHSPRLYKDRLWLLQAGTGEFGLIEQETGQFVPICYLPGFARGLAFAGDYAVIGVSRPRNSAIFEGLKLQDRLDASGVDAICAICVVNLLTGAVEYQLELQGVVQELYDVAILSKIMRPYMVGLQGNEIRFMVRPI